MVIRFRLLPVVLGGVVFVAGLCLATSASTSLAGSFPALYVTFNADHTFAMTLVDGTPVGSTGASGAPIPAGTYQLYLNDTSGSVMEFDLAGPGVSLVDNMTDAEEMAASYVETFQPSSTYTYRDDYRPGVVWTFATTATVLTSTGSTTTSVGSTTSPSGTSGVKPSGPTSSSIVGSGIKPGPVEGTLDAAVSASGKLTFSYKGRSVTTLRSGRYTIAAVDKSAKDGFWLQETGNAVVPVTGTTFVGKRALTVDLKRGQWFFFPTFVGRKTYFIVVS